MHDTCAERKAKNKQNQLNKENENSSTPTINFCRCETKGGGEKIVMIKASVHGMQHIRTYGRIFLFFSLLFFVTW